MRKGSWVSHKGVLFCDIQGREVFYSLNGLGGGVLLSDQTGNLKLTPWQVVRAVVRDVVPTDLNGAAGLRSEAKKALTGWLF